MSTAQLIDVNAALKECPECGYQNGFHIALKRVEPNGEKHKLAVQLICPSCSAVFDIGLRVCVDNGT